jgi:hypothetical protein
MRGYREVDGCTGKEFTCDTCNGLSTSFLYSIKHNNFEEGDDYWALEKIKDRYQLSLSCWDEVSDEINSHDTFKSLEDALLWCRNVGINNVRVSDFKRMDLYDLEITKV